MPTLSNDVQAVLATDKVRFQGQEVAFVVAEDRYSARDALELIDVDYDDARAGHRRAEGARARRPGHPRRPRGQDRQPLLRLGDRRRGRHRRRLRRRPRWSSAEDIVYPRVHPAPDGDVRLRGRLRAGGRQAHPLDAPRRRPHAHRTVYALVSGLPEHKIRVIAPDIGGGFGNKVPIYPGYVCAIVASLVIGKPVKWMEDRTENLVSTGFARDYIMRGEIAATKDGKILAIRTNVLADHGAFNGTAAPDQVPGRVLRRVHRQLRPRGGPLQDDGRLHEQGARRRRLRLLVPHHRGRVPRRAARRLPRLRPGDGPGRAAAQELHPARPVPVHDEDRLGLRLGRLRADHAPGHGDGRLRRAPPRAGREAGQAAS